MWGTIFGAGTNLIGGYLQSRAAKKAAEIQANAAKGVADQTTGVATDAAQWMARAGETAASGVDLATDRAIAGVQEGTVSANELLAKIYEQAGGLTNPYRQAGQAALEQLGQLGGEKFQFSEDDPSFQWRLQQGQKALEASAAARGTLLSGSTAKSLLRYAQGAASQEYQAAFDRYQTDRAQRGGILAQLVGAGQTATGQQLAAGAQYGSQASDNIVRGAGMAGQFDINGRSTAGNFRYGAAVDAGRTRMDGQRIAAEAITGGANAQAAGVAGSGAAWSNAITGAGNAVQEALTLRSILPQKGKIIMSSVPSTRGNRNLEIAKWFLPSAQGAN